MSNQQAVYGGQAVIEGVMMRGPTRMAVAVRRPDGEIVVRQEEIRSLMQRYPILNLPILRGMVALVESLSLGMSALMYSAGQAMPEEEPLSKKEMTISSVVGFTVAIGVFVVLPTLITSWIKSWLSGIGMVNVIEALLRLGMFIGYLVAISMLKDIQRVFQYHGAEHKVINTFEAGAPLTVEESRRFSREHKRCGTSFLLYVVVISIAIFSLVSIPNVWIRIVSRLALMPVVAGVSFELIRVLGQYNNSLTMLISRPGMWLQGLTTREPDDSQLEVAIAAFNSAREGGTAN